MQKQKVLQEGKERLERAQEDVKEEVERERLGREVELLNGLLEPKVSPSSHPIVGDGMWTKR